MSVYRAFMLFNAEAQQVLLYIRRGTNKSFTQTVRKIIEEINLNDQKKHYVYTQGGHKSEWWGILDNQTRCYFCVMTFLASSEPKVIAGLHEIKTLFQKVPDYHKLNEIDLRIQFSEQLQNVIDQMEIDYINATPEFPRYRKLSTDQKSIGQMNQRINQLLNDDPTIMQFNSQKNFKADQSQKLQKQISKPKQIAQEQQKSIKESPKETVLSKKQKQNHKKAPEVRDQILGSCAIQEEEFTFRNSNNGHLLIDGINSFLLIIVALCIWLIYY